ncbi:hypothetical protein DH2020_029239 [Rehmannia glutinosa]|uniref:Uncharacterized protein n=1 Tax=Rehmannia glutinosa TaxID=99300 RepID=A0ABR0VSQ9_REHGL
MRPTYRSHYPSGALAYSRKLASSALSVVLRVLSLFQSYSNPRADAIADKFLNQHGLPNDNDRAFAAHNDPVMRQCCQEITNLESQLNPADGMGEGLLVPAPTRPAAGFTMDPNIQGLNGQLALYGNNEGMLTYNASFVLGGSIDPTMFDFGGSSNSNVAIPTNPGEINPNETFFPDVVTTNPEFEYFDPLDPMVGNFDLSLDYQFARSSSNAMLPHNFSNPNDMGAYGHVGANTSNQAGRGHGDVGAYDHAGASTSNQRGVDAVLEEHMSMIRMRLRDSTFETFLFKGKQHSTPHLSKT